jgi:2-oxoglutarate dehydrogenase E2 component (dihydrolipoamide succinyltransferase)
VATEEGDAVNVGEPLVELETDKIDLEVAAPQAGVLKRSPRDGADVKVGECWLSSRRFRARRDTASPTQDEAARGRARPKGASGEDGEQAREGGYKPRPRRLPANAAQQKRASTCTVSGIGDAGPRHEARRRAGGRHARAEAAAARFTRVRCCRPAGRGGSARERVRMSKRRATDRQRPGVEAAEHGRAIARRPSTEVDMSRA